MTERRKVRCAIYTRKSSEEGLEQAFNSLDAQHEACAAYVASQKHEGWVLLKDRYDDGGISGGTLERPALQRLLGEIEAGRVDRVVVYKVDRLTRSLADFAKLVERFDKVGASFVSVTQSFNTATSMGRLTLNVLLSFAQFEREVAAERIRDKIAASKRKGMWMGGNVSLGYEAKERTLVVNEAEAETVRAIFGLYLQWGKIRLVKDEADRRDLRTKLRPHLEGRARGGAPFSRGHIHQVLTNPVYIGRIRHGAKTYPGVHDAIIDQATWDAVQSKLAENAAKDRGSRASAGGALLAGKMVDETNDRLTATHANKRGRRYRYYVSNRLIAKGGDARASGSRIPAATLEQVVADALARRLGAPGFIAGAIRAASASEIEVAHARCRKMSDTLGEQGLFDEALKLIAEAQIRPDAMSITLALDGLAKLLGVGADRLDPERLSFDEPVSIRKRGVETRIVLGTAPVEIDRKLAGRISASVRWMDELRAGASMEDIAGREGVPAQRLTSLLRLSLLATDIIKAVSGGAQPERLTVDAVLKSPHLDLWSDQQRWVSRL